MKEADSFLIIDTDELEWEDGTKVIGLPPGVEVKIVAEGFDGVSERVDKFVKFPPGYTEPLHIHDHLHSTLVIEGEMHFVLGDEDRVVGPGTLVHIPRNTRHRSRPVNGPATFLTVKSPAGNGKLDQDYQLRPEAVEIEALYPGKKK